MARTTTQMLMAIVALTALAACGGGGSTHASDAVSSATSQAAAPTSASPFARTRGASGATGPHTLTRARRAAILGKYALAAVEVKTFGTAASGAELAAISNSIKGYLAAVSAHEYAKACSLTLASRQQPQHGKRCPELLAASFTMGYYKGIDKTFPSLAVVGARVSEEAGGKGYALLAKSGAAKPEEFMAMRREGGTWKTVVFAPFSLRPKTALERYEASLHE